MFHLHKYSDWSISQRGKVVHQIYKTNQMGTYIVQERYCHKCGKTQIQTQKTTMRNDVILIPESHKVVPKHDKVIGK